MKDAPRGIGAIEVHLNGDFAGDNRGDRLANRYLDRRKRSTRRNNAVNSRITLSFVTAGCNQQTIAIDGKIPGASIKLRTRAVLHHEEAIALNCSSRGRSAVSQVPLRKVGGSGSR